MSLALVYLSRGVDGGLCSAEDFFEAYRTFPAGCSHDLIVIAKGWSCSNGKDEMRRLAEMHNASVVEMPDDGLDWGAYMRLAPQISHDYICFLNTHSRPCVDGWLNLLRIAANTSETDVGAVGATASWETLAPALPQPSVRAENNSPLVYPLRLIRNTVNFLKNRRNFQSFPNPHLRSNAFIVRRRLFLDFIGAQKIPKCRLDSAILESGRSGFPAYLASHSLRVLVAGADGKVYRPDQWINSGTFRVPGQSNVLVADNQTIAYDSADMNMKKVLEQFAWGREFS